MGVLVAWEVHSVEPVKEWLHSLRVEDPELLLKN
jgi:hypothetical protein